MELIWVTMIPVFLLMGLAFVFLKSLHIICSHTGCAFPLGFLMLAVILVWTMSYQRSEDRTDDDGVVTEPATKPKPKIEKPKRPSSRSNASARSKQAAAKNVSSLELPPRAGEIPVGQELAQGAAEEQSHDIFPPQAPLEAASATTQEPPAISATAVALEPATETPPSSASAMQPAAEPTTASRATTQDAAAPSEITRPAPAPAVAPIVVSTVRPDWLDTLGKLTGSVYRTSVKSGLYVTVPECQRALDAAIRREIERYIDDYLGEGAAHKFFLPQAYIKKHLVKEQFAEVVESESVGPMQQIHARLEFDDDARYDFQRRWHDAMVGKRLWTAEVGAVSVLGVLGAVYGFLKIGYGPNGLRKTALAATAALVSLIAVIGFALVS